MDAVNAAQPEPYRSCVAGLVDVDEFMRILAMERIVGNWDSYGYARGKNMYAYKPTKGRWALLPWDIDFVFNSGGTGDIDRAVRQQRAGDRYLPGLPGIPARLLARVRGRRQRPAAAATFAARVDPRYNAHGRHGVGPESPQGLKDYVAAPPHLHPFAAGHGRVHLHGELLR